MSENTIKIDGREVVLNGEKNLLEVIRKAGIDLPTFCYYKELSIYGACRMCMIEYANGSLDAACSAQPRPGMEIYTNTPKLRKHKKMILELLLANHCRDCTACAKNGNCKLQEFADRYGVRQIRFKNTAPVPAVDNSSVSILRDTNKCILCGSCVRMCSEVQNVHAIDFVRRSSSIQVSPAFDSPIAESPCVGCGQCAAVCPTGAITVQDDTDRLWDDLGDRNAFVAAQIAPAVRVAVAKEFGLATDSDTTGKITAAMHRIGFDRVYDTSTGADITVIEEANEFAERLKTGENIPLFTSCCPAWINYASKKHPELLNSNISSCCSPMQMFASVLQELHKDEGGKRFVSVAIMPCTAKKFEAAREEFIKDGKRRVDYSMTTQELIRMIRRAGIDFAALDPEPMDDPLPAYSGAGVIFGVTGGVTEAVLRYLGADLRNAAQSGTRGLEGIKEFDLPYQGKTLKIAVVSGLKNAETIIERIQSGSHYDLVEVMACPGGCINGGGQPIGSENTRSERMCELYAQDENCELRASQENPTVKALYEQLLRGREHELLHVKYRV